MANKLFCYILGGHNWFSMSSKTKLLEDGRYQLLKYCSWTTSAGFADFYTVEVTSPNFGGNYMNESVFLMYKVMNNDCIGHSKRSKEVNSLRTAY